MPLKRHTYENKIISAQFTFVHCKSRKPIYIYKKKNNMFNKNSKIKSKNNILINHFEPIMKNKSYNFNDEWYRFLRYNSLHAYRWMVEPHRHILEKLMWIIVHLIGFILIVFVFIYAWDDYNASPLVTSLYDTLYPISEVPFPGVSVCNNNRISKRAAIQYAKELYAKNPEINNITYYLNSLKFMGRLYDFGMDEQVSFLGFQEFLDQYDNGTLKESYDVSQTMEMLSPKCSDMLLKCFWRGIEQQCMLKNVMMEYRKTQYGYCCTFNFVRPDVLVKNVPKSHFVNEIGIEYGLVLLINGSSDDYFYPLFNFKGFVITIFNPLEFPDVSSGGVSEKIAVLGTETFVRIDSKTVQTTPDVRRYSPKTRGCLFDDELPNEYGGRYKRSDCIVNCRIRNIIALCGCVPYQLPMTNLKKLYASTEKVIPKCSLEQIPCLNHYKSRWYSMLPKVTEFNGLEMDIEEGLYCPTCLPTCTETQYKVTSYSLPLMTRHTNDSCLLCNIHNVSDLIILRVYLGQKETWLYKQSVALEWFEIISNFGGLGGVITGFSLVTLAEYIYFILRQLYLIIDYYHTKKFIHTIKIQPVYCP